MAVPTVTVVDTQEVTAANSITFNSPATFAEGDMLQVIIGKAGRNIGTGPPDGVLTGPGEFGFGVHVVGNNHGVGFASSSLWEYQIDSPTIDPTFTWSLTLSDTDDMIGALVHIEGDGPLESGGYQTPDRSGIQKLNMATIDPPWTSADTVYLQFWVADYTSTVTNTGETTELFDLQHSNGLLSLAGYAFGVAASGSYTPQTDVLDPATDTAPTAIPPSFTRAVNWVGIGEGVAMPAEPRSYWGILTNPVA